MLSRSQKILVLCLCIAATWGIVASEAFADNQCEAIGDFSTSTLHIPCLSIGSTSYSVDLSLVSNNPLALQVAGYTLNSIPNLSGNWLYNGNLVASDGTIEYSFGPCQATQNNGVASFTCQTQYYLSTGDQGNAELDFSANVSATGIDIIDEDIICSDTAGQCTCTLEGSGALIDQALTVNFTIVSKTCGSAFSVPAMGLLTKT